MDDLLNDNDLDVGAGGPWLINPEPGAGAEELALRELEQGTDWTAEQASTSLGCACC